MWCGDGGGRLIDFPQSLAAPLRHFLVRISRFEFRN